VLLPADAELIARVVDHDDRHAFAELVRRHQALVRALLRRLTCGDFALADDLAQETFLRAYRALRQYQGGAKLSSWLYRIAYNVFLSARARRHDELGRVAHDVPRGEPVEAERAVANVDVARAMAALSEPERACITLAFVAGATHEEIAAVLECPLGTAKTHILRAKEKLRVRLSAWAPKEAL